MLYVKDLERMKRFYRDMLGVEPSNSDWTDVWAAFDTGGLCFHLHAIPAGIAEDFVIASPPVARESAPEKLIFEVKDVEEARARFEAVGAQTLRRAWQKPGVAFDAVDPEGNIFQICASRQGA